MKQADLPMLVFIAKKAGLHGYHKGSTSEIAKQVGISQQSVSRKLLQLEKEGLIQRKANVSGIEVSLTRSGIEKLKTHHNEISELFLAKKAKEIILEGKVVSGLGEGKYYLSISQYAEQFRKKFSFNPYPGTLNLEADAQKAKEFLSTLSPIYLQGFETKQRTFGGINCYKVRLNSKLNALLVVPERTVHKENR